MRCDLAVLALEHPARWVGLLHSELSTWRYDSGTLEGTLVAVAGTTSRHAVFVASGSALLAAGSAAIHA